MAVGIFKTLPRFTSSLVAPILKESDEVFMFVVVFSSVFVFTFYCCVFGKFSIPSERYCCFLLHIKKYIFTVDLFYGRIWNVMGFGKLLAGPLCNN